MRNTILSLILASSLVFLFSCGKKVDENKPIGEVKAEAEKMSVADLKAMAMKYKETIEAKKADIEKITAKLKEIPVTQMLGEQAKQLKGDIDNLNKSISALKERFQIYYDQLKTKGGDLSGLQI
jgi:polyhydroxyalkanoate synthesis regulator phasin